MSPEEARRFRERIGAAFIVMIVVLAAFIVFTQYSLQRINNTNVVYAQSTAQQVAHSVESQMQHALTTVRVAAEAAARSSAMSRPTTSAIREQAQQGRPDLAELPIVALTADAFNDDVKRAEAAGMNAHLAKPMDFGKLAAVLGEYLV